MVGSQLAYDLCLKLYCDVDLSKNGTHAKQCADSTHLYATRLNICLPPSSKNHADGVMGVADPEAGCDSVAGAGGGTSPRGSFMYAFRKLRQLAFEGTK